MYNPQEKEIWKEYPLNYEFEGNYRLEISNLGRVKSFNKNFPEGDIIKGSLQGGFPIFKTRLFKKRSENQLHKINSSQKIIDDLNTEIKILVKKKADSAEVFELRKKRDTEIQKRKKINININKSREINVAFLIHKAVATLFLPAAKDVDAKFVIHKDFVKENNAAENLAWATQKELTDRSSMHPKTVLNSFNRQFKASSVNPKNAKLTERDVLFIKMKLKKGMTQRKLALKFGVSEMQIHRIKSGENWKHVELMEDILEKRHKKWQAT